MRFTVGVVLGVSGFAFEAIGVAAAMPVAAEELSGLPLYAWAFSLFTVAMMLATAMGGRWCDRGGVVVPMMLGYAVFVAGLLAGAGAPSMGWLLAARLAMGAGAGMANVATFVLVARVLSAEQRARIMVWISGAWVVPGLVGPALAGVLTRHVGWQWVFAVVIPVMALAVVLMWPALAAVRREGADAPGEGGAASVPLWAAGAAAAGAVLLQVAGQAWQWWSPWAAAAALVVLAVGARRLMPAPGAHPGLRWVLAARALIPAAFFAAEAFVPLMLRATRGLDVTTAGLVLTVGTLGWFVGTWTQSQPSLVVGRDRYIKAGAMCVAAGLGVVTLVIVTEGSAWWVGLAWVPASFGMGLLVASTSLASMSLSARAEQGRNSAALQLSEALGVTVITGAAGTVFAQLRLETGETTSTFAWVSAATAVVAVVGAVATLPLMRLPALRDEHPHPDGGDRDAAVA